jgi:hypothetical protein
MRCFVKKNVFENKMVRGFAISKNLSSGIRNLQKIKNRWSTVSVLSKNNIYESD